MLKEAFRIRMIVSAFCLCLAGVAMAQDQQASHEAGMQALTRHMAPGEPHQMMAQANGKWKTQTSLWMTPGQPPEKTEGTCVNSMLLGGRYQQSIYSGTMMGMPFEGIGVSGYDNTKKQYQSTWIDNMGTSISWFTGSYDAETKIMSQKGTMVDPMSGGDIHVRSTTRFEGPDRYVMEMYMKMGDQEMKTLEIIHTRMK